MRCPRAVDASEPDQLAAVTAAVALIADAPVLEIPLETIAEIPATVEEITPSLPAVRARRMRLNIDPATSPPWGAAE